ncbi:MAG: glycosyltransferase [Candidatus Eisenbacteria bacterium]
MLSVLLGACVALYVMVQLLIVGYASHRYLTLWRCFRRSSREPVRRAPASRPLPTVTVQLPLFNERLVAERLIDAVARLDYPPALLQIQVLDDSTDETTALVSAAVERHRSRGVPIELHHREALDGFKAGALAPGSRWSKGEILVAFDADFLPPPGFLRQIVPHFAEPDVGMVQARWCHLNRDRSLLTMAQAVMLDAHFFLEHRARARAGLFFNFNGTAGAWRRACIESAGGWSHDTLTEDLDLSYRAQLAGWRFVFDAAIEAPAELPAGIAAFKTQQRRWTRGSIQTARKLLPAIFRSRLPPRVKIESFMHLTGNAPYPLLLALGLLLLPVLIAPPVRESGGLLILELFVIALGFVPVCAFLVAGQLASGARGWRVARDVAAALVVGAGLSLNNAIGMIEGLRGELGDWQRTPKTGDGVPALKTGSQAPYLLRRTRQGAVELLLASYFALLALVPLSRGQLKALPFMLLLALGFGCFGLLSYREARAAGPRPGRLTRVRESSSLRAWPTGS